MIVKEKARRGLSRTLAIIFFIIVLIYLAYHAFNYITREKPIIYTVGDVSSLSSDKTYTGLIVRNEEIVISENSGYVNYLMPNASRVSLGENFYCIDESGRFNSAISSYENSAISNKDAAVMSGQVYNFRNSYSSDKFDLTYGLKTELQYEMYSIAALASADKLTELGVNPAQFHTPMSGYSGLVVYYTDGFENYDPSLISSKDFDKASYNKNQYVGGNMYSKGDAVGKIITDETWSIYIQLSPEEAALLSGKSRINVVFNEIGVATTVLFEEITGSDGLIYGKLSLTKYMINYCNSRYLSITVKNDSIKGLKIPDTSIINQEVYKIPLDLITNGGGSVSEGFNKEVYNSGRASVSFICPQILYKDDNYCYIALDEIEDGSILLKPDSTEKFLVSEKISFPGVYNVNKGFAVFKVVDILSDDGNYSIVKNGVSYSIGTHDNILLYGENGTQGMMIYQ